MFYGVFFFFFWFSVHISVCAVTDLVVFSTFPDAGQPNNRLTVLQSLVKDGVRITLDCISLALRSFVELLHLLLLYVLQCLKRRQVII